jgi:hypothetical protein
MASKNTTATTAPTSFDALLATADTFDGVDITDKATLVGVPFIVTGVWFETGSRGIEYVYMDVMTKTGDTVTINDSSTTGIKAQMREYLAKLGQNPAAGDVVSIALHIPGGLRKTEYDVTDDSGRAKKARTYYLTRSGARG